LLITDFENCDGAFESEDILCKMHGFSTGRRHKPKIVRSTIDDEDEDIQDVTSGTESLDIEPSSILTIKRANRPTSTKKPSGSKLKLSFGADDVLSLTQLRLKEMRPMMRRLLFQSVQH
jgi:hypothetical protein